MSRHTDNLEMANAQMAFTKRKSRQWAKDVISKRNETIKENMERNSVPATAEIRVGHQTQSIAKVVQTNEITQFWFIRSPTLIMMLIVAVMMFSVSYCGRLAVEKSVRAGEINLSLPMKKVIRNLEQE